MTNREILNKFAIYSDYDSDQNSFNLLSATYKYHEAGKVIEKLLSEGYDTDANLSVLYAKHIFMYCLENTRLTLLQTLQNPETYSKEKEMFDIFCSDEVQNVEKQFIDTIYKMYQRIMQNKAIGITDFKPDTVIACMGRVISSIDKLHTDVYMKGGVPKPITNISTKIHVFELLSQAVMAIEQSKDGIYLCFINSNGSADCYFAFICKSNGTIWSRHDRINEVYIGQHKNLRNARWTEEKNDSIFPYDHIFSFSEYDYKGYATKYSIDESKLNYCELGETVFVPILMAMMLLCNRYNGKMPNGDIRYMSGLILPPDEVKDIAELALTKTSEIAAANRNINISYDMNALLNGSYAEEFKYPEEKEKLATNWYERHMWNEHEEAKFHNWNQDLVEKYGSDFRPDISHLFRSTLPVPAAIETEKQASDVNPEFVGSEKRFRIQVYYEARKQLATHIATRYNKDYEDFGGKEGAFNWYICSLKSNLAHIISILCDFAIKREQDPDYSPTYIDVHVPAFCKHQD